MIILGIDPGFGRLGYAILEKTQGNPKLLATDTIETTKDTSHPERLRELSLRLENIFTEHKPAIVSLERIFFTSNQKTIVPVAEARGIVLLTAAIFGIKVYEYTPPEIKLAVTGSGKADKKAIKKMVQATLRLERLPRHDDATDAIAIALTAAYDRRLL